MKKAALGYLAAGLAAAIVAGAAHWHVAQGTSLIKTEYVAKSAAEVERGAKDVEQALQIIYHNLRTLASLPSMRSISRHGENLTPEARATFQMIYNNLASSVSVSEVYIIPADFDPDRVDPVTARPEEPVIMFDELILNAGAGMSVDERASNPQAVAAAANNGPPEIETYEYKLLRQQAQWFSTNVADNSAITGLNVPMIGGAEVITCDNTYFITSHNDTDRKGAIFSVPFFGEDGKFRGMVSAIILSKALGALLPNEDYVLTNPGYGYIAAKANPPAHVQDMLPALQHGNDETRLLFSKTVPLALMDPQSAWSVWAGYSDRTFYQSPEYLALQNLRLYGYGLALILFAGGCLLWFMVTRDARRSQLAAVRLAKARDEAKQAEAEARALAEQFQDLNGDISRLNHDLNEKVRMLQDAQNEIVRKGKMAQLGQLTATIAHELRNPMGSIRTTSFLIRRKAVEQMPALAPLLARIDTGISRCDDIITQLLDFARTKKPDFSSTDFDQWLADTVQEEAASLPESVEIECNLGLGDMPVDFDPGRMRRVLVNLLSNAAEAMVGKPGMPASNGPAHPRISLATRLTARGVEISVADNGPGMDRETIAKIREPLFTTKNFGTGLGIPAVERILELHGGGLDVASAPGQGATFTAWLPQTQPKTQAA
jgi:signal transduction histidine kinase